MSSSPTPAETTLDALIELVDEPVAIIDRGLAVVGWNRAAERLLERRRGEVLGAPCLAGIRAAGCVGGCPILRGELEGPVTVHRRDGTIATYQRRATVVRDAEGEVATIVERLVPVTEPTPDRDSFHGVETGAPAMLAAVALVRRAARVPVHVLLTGERGTGRRALAAGLHAESRATGPLVAVPRGRVDWTEVLGRARGGTLLVEDVDLLPLPDQAALAGSWPDADDVRVVATAALGALDGVLSYRVRGMTVAVPPLRERSEDVLALAGALLGRWSAAGPRRARGFSAGAAHVLRRHDWPGNLQELAAVVSHAYVSGDGPEVVVEDLPDWLGRAPARDPDEGPTAGEVRDALERADGRVAEAAERLGMSRSTFWRLRRRHGL